MLCGHLCHVMSWRLTGSFIDVSHNNFTGGVPSALTSFSSVYFDYNCLSNCSLIPQPWCTAPTSADQVLALVDLYNSTDGLQWLASTHWTIGDPCLNGWYNVSCVTGGPGCYANVTYVTSRLFYL